MKRALARVRRLLRLRRSPGRRPEIRRFLLAFWPFILGTALVAGGLAAILIGYLGASGTLIVGLQMPYLISGGILGLALVVFGSALLLLHGMNRQARLTRRLLEQGRERPAAPDGPSGNGLVLVPSGAASFHRPDCRLVAGKRVRRLKPETATKRGLSPCGLCDPVPKA